MIGCFLSRDKERPESGGKKNGSGEKRDMSKRFCKFGVAVTFQAVENRD